MAKGKKKKDEGEKQGAAAPDPGIAAFEAGHYPTARQLFQEKLKTDLADGERRLLTGLLAAMRVDDHAWKTGLGCVLLYVLVVAIAILKQP